MADIEKDDTFEITDDEKIDFAAYEMKYGELLEWILDNEE